MSWRMARSLDVLLKQVNEAFPNRDKSSDGGIGDANHATRSSDHNPWVKDTKGQPVVTARDFTHDPVRGLHGEVFTQLLCQYKDPRIKYIIWNRHIYSGANQGHPAWAPRPYTGANPHNHHVHISVNSAESLFDSTMPWRFDWEQRPAERAIPAPKILYPVLALGSTGEEVRNLQKRLNIEADGWFGAQTETAVKGFQSAHSLVADGIVGRYTWDALGVGKA